MTLDGLVDDRANQIPRACNLADDNYYFGRQPSDEHSDTSSQIVRHLSYGFLGFWIPLFGQPQQIIEGRSLGRRSISVPAAANGQGCLQIIANRGGIGGIDLPTTSVTTSALEAVLNNRSVSELTRP